MTTQTRCFNLLGIALALLGPGTMAIAADPSAPGAQPPSQVQAVTPTPSPTAPSKAAAEVAVTVSAQGSVAVRPGDTLDRLIARHLAHLPLRQALLRQALIKKNPAAFKGGKAEGLLAGATLQLPVLADFRYLFVTASDALPFTPAAPEPAAGDPRKSWVRFP